MAKKPISEKPDNQQILSELIRAKALFQLRVIEAIMRGNKTND